MIAALIVVALSGLASTVVLHLSLRSVTRTFGEIEARAHAERHVLAGRIQRPELFPTAPVAPAPLAPGEAPKDEPEPVSGFEAAGQDLSHLSNDQLIDVFGAEFVNGK